MFGKITAYHGTQLIEVKIIASELPEIMPLVSDGVDNLGLGYTLAPGSTMIVTSSGKRYILGTDAEWSELDSGSLDSEITVKTVEEISITDKIKTIHILKINGKSTVSGNVISSVGDSGLTITAGSKTLTVSSNLPLRGINDDIRDSLAVDQSTGGIYKKCGYVADLGNQWWDLLSAVEEDRARFYTELTGMSQQTEEDSVPEILVPGFTAAPFNKSRWVPGDVAQYLNNQYVTFIVPPEINTSAKMKAYMSGIPAVYGLASPATYALSAAEMSAFRALTGFDSMVNVSNNANAEMTVTYSRQTAEKTLFDILQAQIDALREE